MRKNSDETRAIRSSSARSVKRLLQPLRPNSPGSEEDLVEVENPKRGRDDEQANADGCVGEMQNDVIIHDDFIGSLKLCASSCERFPTRLRYRQDG
jgi:hypothetical protein